MQLWWEAGLGAINFMRVLPPFYFLGSILVMGLLHGLVPVLRVVPIPQNALGAIPLGAGIVIAVLANRLFHRLGTTVHPHAEASRLVADGPFRFSRNPMYLGLVLALVGVAVLLGSLTPWIVLPPFVWVISSLFIRHEEKKLEALFGDEYRDYKRRVRRWF